MVRKLITIALVERALLYVGCVPNQRIKYKPNDLYKIGIIKIHSAIKHRRLSSLNGFRDASSLPFLP